MRAKEWPARVDAVGQNHLGLSIASPANLQSVQTKRGQLNHLLELRLAFQH